MHGERGVRSQFMFPHICGSVQREGTDGEVFAPKPSWNRSRPRFGAAGLDWEGMASATLESLIESYVVSQGPSTEQASSAEAISKEILGGRLAIQSLILTLGTYLTTTDNIVRARGTLLLSDILAGLSEKLLEDTAIKSLTNFYSARLGDWHCLRGAVLGSLSLLRRRSNVGAVEVAEARDVAKSALANLHVQALAQRDRMLCLELFECLLEKHAAAVAPLEGDLVFGVVAALEEEKDPRCLMLAFRIIKLLARLYPDPNGPIASCAEELFDVVSRYFPISFNPLPNSPDGISREDLVTALKDSFACTPIFAPHCIPLLLEKLSSSLRRAKLDALNYLGHCGLIYGAKVSREYTVPVWEALKAELLPLSVPSSSTSLEPQDLEIVREALSCLGCWVLIFQVEKNLSLESGEFLRLILQDGLVEDLVTCLKNDTESRGHSEPAVKDRAKIQVEAAGRVLAESAEASPSSCFLICKQVLTQVMTATGLMVEAEASTDEDRDCFRSVIGLNVVLQIVVAARNLGEKVFLEHGQSAAIPSKKWLDPMRERSENLITAFNQAITDNCFKDSPALGVAGLQALASFPAPLSPLSSDQLRRILLILNVFLVDGTEQKLWTNVFTALEKISSVEERSGTMDGDVGILTVVVPDLLEAVREAKTGTLVEKSLEVLAKICGPRSAARQLVITHLTESVHLDLLGAEGTDKLDEICAKLVYVLQCLSEDILPWCDGQSADQFVTMELSMEIWRIASTQAMKSNQEVFKWSLRTMRRIVLKCDSAVQSKILQKGVELLFDKRANYYEEEMDWFIALVGSVIVSLRPSTTVPEKQSLLRVLMRAAQSQNPLLVTETAAQAVASVLNKWVAASTNEADDFTLDKAVTIALGEGCLSEILRNTVPDGSEETDLGRDVSKISGVRAAAWIGKGLAMRGHSGVSEVASVLLRLLLLGASKNKESCSLAMAAAEGLGIILKDSDVCLNKAHHAVIRPLYKQRFFNSMLSPLLEAVRSSRDTHVKLWLYRGIGHLISGTPHVALLADGSKVFPVILGTLSFVSSDLSDSDLLISTLLSLSAFLVDVNEGRSVAGEHVSSIVKRMLILIQYQHSVVVREIALQCLGAVVGLPFSRVYPLRGEVLRALSVALDDKKRVVRKEAVRCRQAWSLIASK